MQWTHKLVVQEKHWSHLL